MSSGLQLDIIETGFFKLDGGAMFGVVPKSMWSRINTPDDNNMCTWSMRCLCVRHGDKVILIDTGLGDKQDAKFRSYFYPHGDDSLIQSLKLKGIAPEEVTDVILTHFHFDHVGGAIIRDQHNRLVPTFPNATYHSNDLHYKWAIEPNPREKASFLKENFVPLKDQGLLQLWDVQQEIAFDEYISFHFVYGHTSAMMIPHIKMPGGKTLVYCADLLPSHGHISMPFVMAYDVQPLETLKEKQELYDRVANDDYYLFLEHDKDYSCIQIMKNEKGRYQMSGGDKWNEVRDLLN